MPGHARDRQSDAVDIPGCGEVGLLGGRHAEFGTGDEQCAHVGPAEAATGGARDRHLNRPGQLTVAIVPEQAAAIELAHPDAAFLI